MLLQDIKNKLTDKYNIPENELEVIQDQLIQMYDLIPNLAIVPLFKLQKMPSLAWGKVDDNIIRSKDDILNRNASLGQKFTYKGVSKETGKVYSTSRVVTGYFINCAKSGLTIVDLDDKGGKTGTSNFKVLLESLGLSWEWLINNTLVCRSATGGYHIYFKHVQGLKSVADTFHNKLKKLGINHEGSGIDIKTTGGGVVAPGTLVSMNDGAVGLYTIDNPVSPSDMPVELVQAFKKGVNDLSSNKKFRVKSSNKTYTLNASKVKEVSNKIKKYEGKSWYDFIKEKLIDDEYFKLRGHLDFIKTNAMRCPIHGSSSGNNDSNFTRYENEDGVWVYKCWSKKCVDAGSIIDVVAVNEGMTVQEAVLWIAKEFNLRLPRKYSSETINHPQYTANNTYSVSKYIGENIKGIDLIFKRFKINENINILLVAPTGSGKTYTILRELQDRNIKAIFVVPQRTQVQQIESDSNYNGNDRNLVCIDEYGNIKDALLNKENIIVATWDKLDQLSENDKLLTQDYILVCDEVHQLIVDHSFRLNATLAAWENSKLFKNTLHITATPLKLDFSRYGYIYEYFQDISTQYRLNLYDGINDNEVINIMNNSNKFLLMQNNTNMLKYYAMNVKDKKVDYITSKLKNKKIYKLITKESTLGEYDGVLSTNLYSAGVNLNDEDIDTVIVVGVKDLATIVQFAARPRKSSQIDIHVFNCWGQIENVNLVENMVKATKKTANDLATIINSANTINAEGYSINGITNKYSAIAANHAYLMWKDNKCLVNELAIRNDIYQTYTNTRAIHNFKVLMSKHYKDIVVHEDINKVNVTLECGANQEIKLDKVKGNDLGEFTEQLKEEKKQLIDKISNFKMYMLAYTYIVKNNKIMDLDDIEIPAAIDLLLDITKFEFYKEREQAKKDDAEQDIEYKPDTKHTDHELKLMEIMEFINDFNLIHLLSDSGVLNNIEVYNKLVEKRYMPLDVAWEFSLLHPKSRSFELQRLGYIIKRDVLKDLDVKAKSIRYEEQIRLFLEKHVVAGGVYTDKNLEEMLKDLLTELYPEVSKKTKGRIVKHIKGVNVQSMKTILRRLFIVKSNRATLRIKSIDDLSSYVRSNGTSTSLYKKSDLDKSVCTYTVIGPISVKGIVESAELPYTLIEEFESYVNSQEHNFQDTIDNKFKLVSTKNDMFK